MPLVRGETSALHDEIFTEMTYHAAYQPQRAVRTERWKYIRRFHDYPHPVLANCDDSASKELLVEHGWGDSSFPRSSSTTSYSTPTRRATSRSDPSMRRRSKRSADGLEDWMRETEDPLLEGPVPLRRARGSTIPAQASPNDPWRNEAESSDGAAVR